MRLIKDTHEKKCTKFLRYLENNLEKIKNEYNLEYKAKDINKSSSIEKQNSLKNRSINSLPNIYHNIINPDDNEEKKTIFQQRILKKKQIINEKRIKKEYEEFQDQIKNKIKIN